MDRHGVVLPKLAKVGLESTNPEDVISFQNFRWSNPHPEKTIRSIDILSACGGASPQLPQFPRKKSKENANPLDFSENRAILLNRINQEMRG